MVVLVPRTNVCDLPDLRCYNRARKFLTAPEMFMGRFWQILASRLLWAALILPLAFAASVRTSGQSRPAPAGIGSPGQLVIRQIKIVGSKDSVEIEIEASAPIVPQAQVLTGPDRLVLDFPDAVPGHELRSQSIYVGAVKDIRAGLFRSRPPVTRLVVDWDSPETYQVFPAGRTVMIKMTTALPSGVPVAIDKWREPAVQLVASSSPPAVQPRAPPDPPKPSLEVEFANGLLTIKADRVTLAEILLAVEQRTGAQVSLAPAADQEKVVFDFGPAPAQDVLAHLLNGSKFNFLILNAADDPKKLDRVILTIRTEGGPAPLPALETTDQPPQPVTASSPPASGQPEPRHFPPQQPDMNAPDVNAPPDPPTDPQ